jgi:hypothetical protein
VIVVPTKYGCPILSLLIQHAIVEMILVVPDFGETTPGTEMADLETQCEGSKHLV